MDRTTDYAGDDLKFRAWMREVDAAVEAKVGVSVMDLPDMAFHDWFTDGVKPKAAAARAIRAAKDF